MSQKVLWNCSRAVLESHWSCSGTALELLSNCSYVVGLKLLRSLCGVDLVCVRKCSRTALKALWSSSGTALEPLLSFRSEITSIFVWSLSVTG